MTDKTEAQPEALTVAEGLDSTRNAFGDDNAQSKRRAAAELRRQHAEIQQLKAQNANLRDALADIASGEITRSHCVGPHCTEELGVATADELSSRASGALDWDDLVAPPSTDVGIPTSARQAAPDGQWKCGNEYLPYHPDASQVDPAYRDGWNDCYRAGEAANEHQKAASLRLAEAFPQAAEMFHPLYVEGFKAGHRRGGARGKRSVLRQVGKVVDDLLASPTPTEEPNSAEFEGIKKRQPEREPLI